MKQIDNCNISDHSCPKSFYHQRYRITKNQRHALKNFFLKWCIPYQTHYLNYEKAFDQNAPVILEIGFGMGEATETIALSRPSENFLAAETYMPGIGSLLRRIEKSNIKNLRIIKHDAIEILENMIPPESLKGLHIYFPDPWPKVRHRKRRLIQERFSKLAKSRICISGYVHCTTDSDEYASQIEKNLNNSTFFLVNFKKNSSCGNRPLTKFERRGIKLGHNIYDFIFKRIT